MEYYQKELLISRICSGASRVIVQGRPYIVRRPSREQVYLASEHYVQVYKEALAEGLYTEDDLMMFLLDEGFWDEEKEKLYNKLPKEIEDFKLELYKRFFQSNESKAIRKALAIAKEKLEELQTLRNSYSHLTASGTAAVAQSRYLVAMGLWSLTGNPVFTEYTFWDFNHEFMDQVMLALAESRIDETCIRELARTEPWRNIWLAHKHEGVLFGISPCDYTFEQKGLVSWSSLYDSVYSHPECPAEDIISDDDLLDGWMIGQRRERDRKLKSKQGEELIKNDAIRNSDEVYLVADTVDDAKKVVDMNDDFAKAAQKRRFDVLKKKGEINELDMPDTKQRIMMEFNQKRRLP